jgi:hypothetical protein
VEHVLIKRKILLFSIMKQSVFCLKSRRCNWLRNDYDIIRLMNVGRIKQGMGGGFITFYIDDCEVSKALLDSE